MTIITEFQPQDRVAYVPTHANGDINHPDVEYGTVSSVGTIGNVFVRFDKHVAKFGWSGATSQSCDAADLRKI